MYNLSVYLSIPCYLLLSVALALLNNLEAVILEESSDIASRLELEFDVNLNIFQIVKYQYQKEEGGVRH